jgi:hypothetical protein
MLTRGTSLPQILGFVCVCSAFLLAGLEGSWFGFILAAIIVVSTAVILRWGLDQRAAAEHRDAPDASEAPGPQPARDP